MRTSTMVPTALAALLLTAGATSAALTPTHARSAHGQATVASGTVDATAELPINGRIAYAHQRTAQGGPFDVYTVRADGTHRTRLTFNGRAQDPEWSPDGAHIAYTQWLPHYSGVEIKVMDADGSNKQLLATVTHSSPGGPSTRRCRCSARRVTGSCTRAASTAGTATKQSPTA